jgi:hypothetical protein
MKHGTFKQKTPEQVKELNEKKRQKALSKLKEPRLRKVPTKPKKRVQRISTPLVAWIKAIPASKAHGSGTYQQRLWKLTSDYVRIRDFHAYGTCAATGKHFDTWRGTNVQAGHLKPYSTCSGLFKFDVRNIHAQDGYNNKFGNYDDFRNFEKEVKRRGYDWDLFEEENKSSIGCRLYDTDVIEEIKTLLLKMGTLPEQPDYYERAIMLLEQIEKYKI